MNYSAHKIIYKIRSSTVDKLAILPQQCIGFTIKCKNKLIPGVSACCDRGRSVARGSAPYFCRGMPLSAAPRLIERLNMSHYNEKVMLQTRPTSPSAIESRLGCPLS